MSWKKLACVAMLVGIAGPAMADPSITVDLRRNGAGNPVLNANGNFEWVVKVVPDQSLFFTAAAGSENAGIDGGAVDIEAGFTISASANDSTGQAYAGDFALGGTKGDAFTGTATDSTGEVVFGWETVVLSNGGVDYGEGLEVGGSGAIDDQVFAALGSLFLTANGTTPTAGWELDADGSTIALVIEAEGPSTTTTLSTRLVGGGAYAGNGRIAQADGVSTSQNYDNFSADMSFRTIGGDANLDGTVTGGDFALLQNNFNQAGDWDVGDFNGDGNVSGGDFAILQNNFNMSAPAPGGLVAGGSNVPEPSSCLICGLAALGAGLMARRKMAS